VIDLAGVGAIIAAITGLLTALGSVLLQRQKNRAVDTEEIEDLLEIRDEQFRAAMRYIRLLEDDRALTGAPPVRRPAELRPGWVAQRQDRGRARRGRHAADPPPRRGPTAADHYADAEP
jgi:hypothetical protein